MLSITATKRPVWQSSAISVLAEVVAGGAEIEIDPSKGQIGLIAVGHPKPGTTKYTQFADVSFDLDPDSGSGPHYVNELNLVDPTLDATGDNGGALWFNVEPRDE